MNENDNISIKDLAELLKSNVQREPKRRFIVEMFSGANDRISHKRVMSFMSFFVLIGIATLDIFDKHIDVNLIYIFAGLAGGSQVLSIFEKKHKINTNYEDDTNQ